MKQVLDKNQVTANLDLIKQGKAICYRIEYNRYTDEPTFYIWFKGRGIAICQGKKLYWNYFKKEEWYKESYIFEFSGIPCREYLHRRSSKEDRETVEKVLIACGLKTEKVFKEQKPEQRLRELECTELSKIYSMMQGLTGLRGELETRIKQDRWNRNREGESFLALVIYHDKGSFSFPIENYSNKRGIPCTGEIQNIFFNALNLPVTSKLKTA